MSGGIKGGIMSPRIAGNWAYTRACLVESYPLTTLPDLATKKSTRSVVKQHLHEAGKRSFSLSTNTGRYISFFI